MLYEFEFLDNFASEINSELKQVASLEQISIAIGTLARAFLVRWPNSKLGMISIAWNLVACSGSQLSTRINFWIVAISAPSS